MIDLTRRSFLKGIAVVTTGLIVSDFSLLLPKEAIPKGVIPFGKFRAICMYDIESDEEIVHYAILTKTTQLSVQASTSLKGRKAFIKEYHKPMIANLKKEIIHRRIRYKDLIGLEYPSGYLHPKWFQEFLESNYATRKLIS